MEKKEYYAIEIINNRAFSIKQVRGSGWVLPVNGKAYTTLEKAQGAAIELGLKIEKIGSCYEII